MKFGLHFQVTCADWQSPLQRYQEALEQIQLGDELGFDYAWLAEMHFDPRHCITPSPFIVAAAAAERTKRIRLGIAVSLLPLHHPIEMAEDVATLDLLSNGRAEFGAGRGSDPEHYRGYGVPMDESRERFLECLEFIIKSWTEDEFSFDGKYYSARDLSLVPKPLQKPHPPVRIASNSADTFELIGQLGYNMFATPIVVAVPELQEGVERYRRTLREGGHPVDGDELSLQVAVYPAKDAKAARAATKASVTYYLDVIKSSYAARPVQQVAAVNPAVSQTLRRIQTMTYDDWDEVAIYGDPATCVEKLRAFERQFHSGDYNCFFDAGGLIPHSDVMDSMRLFAAEVMPQFR